MRKKLFVFCLAALHCCGVNAQTKITQGEVKGKQSTFIAHQLKPNDSVKYIAVYSKSNKYNEGIPRPAKFLLPIKPKDFNVNEEEVKTTVYHVLSSKINKLRQNRETLDVNFIFKPSGDIIDVAFMLRDNTIITVQEVEEMDKQLRAKVKAKFTGKEYLEYEAITGKSIPTIKFDIN